MRLFGGYKLVQDVASKVFGSGATGQDNVSTAGTPVQLNGGSSQSVPKGGSLTVTAKPSNTGNIYWGYDNTVSSSTGDILTAGSAVEIPTSDVSNIWIDADNNGEGVSWATESDS